MAAFVAKQMVGNKLNAVKGRIWRTHFCLDTVTFNINVFEFRCFIKTDTENY